MEIEGSVIHIMKALASHQPAAPSLIEDDALQVLFHMVANGSLYVLSQFKDGIVPLHTIQLHRHAMQVIWNYLTLCFGGSCFSAASIVAKYIKFITGQVLGLLLANDNGASGKYIRKH
jgi:WD repeat and FYVE domain-containing protein 3